jgi:hypothetical protein
VLHSDIKILDYDLDEMHTLTSKIKEDIEFQRGIIVKLKLEKLISSVWTFETNTC